MPGAIQPHGALIAVDADLKILHASANTSAYLRVGHHALLGRSLSEVFARKTRHNLANGIMQAQAAGCAVDLGPMSFGDQSLTVTVSPAGDLTLFEFETARHTAGASDQTLKDLELLLRQARGAVSRQDLFERSVELLRMLTGYDRVMIFLFDTEGSGTVEAEAVAPGVDSFLGLSFPSWDIPAQARELMLKIPYRYFYDVTARPVPVLTLDGAPTEIDMSLAHLRGPSRVHMEYLRNMRVAASFTLNIVSHGKLWGMISFHHCKPRYPSQRVRRMCTYFLEFFTLQLSNFQVQGAVNRLSKPEGLLQSLMYKTDWQDLNEIFETDLLNDLSGSMRADGAALVYKNSVTSVGLLPAPDQLCKIAARLQSETSICHTANVARDYPDLAPLMQPNIAGFLAAALPDNCLFVFFRQARDRVVKWAGTPEKPISRSGGVARLHPRASFEEYLENVAGTSMPWSAEEVRAANNLWSLLLTSERADLMRKTNRQQSLLIDELNHRVRNILSLIRSLSHQSLNDNDTVQSFSNALDARIASLAAAHDLGACKQAENATLLQIINQEAAPHNQMVTRVICAGTDMGIRSDLAPIFALVMHEMMTNAAKHGALSVQEGVVRVRLTKSSAGIDINWRETGGPTPTSPERKGFGSRLIEKSVPYELNGRVTLECTTGGLTADIFLPKSVLVDKLPRGALTKSVARRVDTEPMQKDFSPAQKRCMLVEDNYFVSLDTARVLNEVGFATIRTAANATDALSLIDDFQPEIAFLDINLSDGETSEIVADRLSVLEIPVVFVTGYGDTMKLGDAYADARVLTKPIREDHLRSILNGLAL